MKRAAAIASLLRDARGVVMLEFVFAFVPLFVLFLGVVQLGLLAAAQLVVQHAAIGGARSAAVVLDDDPQFYDGAPRGELERAPGRDGPRLAAIRRAVYAPLAASAHDPERSLPISTTVGFPLEPGGAVLARTRWDLDDHVNVRVEQRWPCTVPIAARLVCRERGAKQQPLARLSAEATMPMQRAAYAYASERARSGATP